MPMASQLEVEAKCSYDHEMTFGQDEVRYMLDTALRKVSEVGAFTCALESVEDVRKFMQIRFLGQSVRHDLLSQSEADEIYFEHEEKVNVLGMKWVSRNLRMRTSYMMPKSHGVKYQERCYEVHTTRVAWTAYELNYGRIYWGRVDEPAKAEVAELGRSKERVEPSGKHEVVKRVDKEKRVASAAPVIGRKPEDTSVSPPLKARKFKRYVTKCQVGESGQSTC